MKILCGTDIIEIERIKKSVENTGNAFINRVFTEKEIAYCEGRKSMKYQHYAARFAAKEAVFKAINTEAINSISWKDIEIYNQDSGKPIVNLLVDVPFLKNIDLSISHCKNYAVAMVVAEMEEK